MTYDLNRQVETLHSPTQLTHHSSKSVCTTNIFSQGLVPWVAQNLQQEVGGLVRDFWIRLNERKQKYFDKRFENQPHCCIKCQKVTVNDLFNT